MRSRLAISIVCILALSLLLTGTIGSQPGKDVNPGSRVPPEDGKLRIICFGAHPDDCELKAGGVALLWAAQGHHVKFVSVTNGDIGHWREAGGPLARRRTREVQGASKVLGTTVEVLDN